MWWRREAAGWLDGEVLWAGLGRLDDMTAEDALNVIEVALVRAVAVDAQNTAEKAKGPLGLKLVQAVRTAIGQPADDDKAGAVAARRDGAMSLDELDAMAGTMSGG